MKIAAFVLAAFLSVGLAQEEIQCGVAVVPPLQEEDGRITNGEEAVPHSWPWQVAQCRGSGLSCSLNCGATIINENFILSAAHCVIGQNPASVGFKFGAHSLQNTDDNGQGVAAVKAFHAHPDYNSQIIINDIAVVELAEPLVFTDHVRPICIAGTDDHLTQDTQMLDIGWGRLGGFQPVSDTLQQTILNHHDRENCARMFQGLGHPFHDSVICAGGLADLQSVCFGDSGGPYFKKDEEDERYYQYGINSFVFSQLCSGENRPNGFARTAFLCDYLEEIVGEGTCLTPPEAANQATVHFQPLGSNQYQENVKADVKSFPAPIWFA